MAENQGVKFLCMWSSPFGRRIELALKLKGVTYEYVEVDLADKSDLVVELNPVNKQIPILVHNGKPVVESHVILEYIDETWKNHPILPQDPYDRATARFWARFIDEKVLPTAFKMFKAPEQERGKVIQETHELLMFLEKELKGKDFFGGETIGLVDIIGVVIAFWLTRAPEAFGIDLIPEEKFPELRRWIKKLSEIEMVNQCVPPKEKHLEFIRSLSAKPASA